MKVERASSSRLMGTWRVQVWILDFVRWVSKAWRRLKRHVRDWGSDSRCFGCDYGYRRRLDGDIGGGEGCGYDDCFADDGADVLGTECACAVLVPGEGAHDCIDDTCFGEGCDDRQ